MERADQLTIAAGTPGFALMLSAGQAVAEAAMDLVEEGPVVVVAGRGNNGGFFNSQRGMDSSQIARRGALILDVKSFVEKIERGAIGQGWIEK